MWKAEAHPSQRDPQGNRHPSLESSLTTRALGPPGGLNSSQGLACERGVSTEMALLRKPMEWRSALSSV